MATIVDVAQAAGVSPATVSRVINHPKQVRPATRQRVTLAIEKLGFTPSAPARHLRIGSSNSIALVVGDIAQPFHGRLAKAVGRAAEESGLSVILIDLDHREDRLASFLKDVQKRGVSGVILASADDLGSETVRPLLESLLCAGIPTVATVPTPSVAGLPAVTFDYRNIGADATQHLIDAGCSKLLLVGGPPDTVVPRTFNRGVRWAARRNGVSVRAVNGYFRAGGAKAAAGREVRRERPDGIIAFNTPSAIGVLRALADEGASVPRDVLLVVCEEVEISSFMVPTLTTIDANLDRLGDVLISQLSLALRQGTPESLITLPHSIGVRDSSTRSL